MASFTSKNEESVVVTTPFPKHNLKTSYFGRKTNGSLLIAGTNDKMDSVDKTIMEWIDTLYRMVFNKKYLRNNFDLISAPKIIHHYSQLFNGLYGVDT